MIDWLLMPIQALRLFTGEEGFKSPIIGSTRLNRRGLHVWRMKITHAMAARRRKRLEALVSAVERASFDRNGFLEKRDFLPEEQHAALISELRGLSASAREMTEGLAVTRRIPVTPHLLKRAPVLHAFIENPDWRRLTRYVGGFKIERSSASRR